jgi:hypothetical protein
MTTKGNAGEGRIRKQRKKHEKAVTPLQEPKLVKICNPLINPW